MKPTTDELIQKINLPADLTIEYRARLQGRLDVLEFFFKNRDAINFLFRKDKLDMEIKKIQEALK